MYPYSIIGDIDLYTIFLCVGIISALLVLTHFTKKAVNTPSKGIMQTSKISTSNSVQFMIITPFYQKIENFFLIILYNFY